MVGLMHCLSSFPCI